MGALYEWRIHINVREFAWHDLITLYRYRSDLLVLDNTRQLTRGNPLGLAASFINLHPRYGIFTGVSRPSKQSPALIGQLVYRMGNRSARLSYLLPHSAITAPALIDLLEILARQAGEWGACNILAEVEEHDSAFESLRRTGFIVYAWQTVWRLKPGETNGRVSISQWQPASSKDKLAVRNLYQCLVPLLVQGAEALPSVKGHGLVYKQNDEILGYIEGTYGPQGIFLNPFIHPSVDDVGELLRDLVRRVSPLMGRSVYLAMRSYQAWLEPYLQQMDLQVSPRQALLVKHLTQLQRQTLPAPVLNVIENRSAEPTATIARNITSREE